MMRMMIDAFFFFGAFFCVLLLVVCAMVAKMLYDFNADKRVKPQSVYMLKVMPDGSLKLKKYRGNVKYWHDIE